MPMSLNPSLDSFGALYRKMGRELYRAYHERNRIHKADHFYNFCITAHAMRDYFFEHQGLIEKAAQQPYNDIWKENDFLVAVSDIANTAKHFTLRESNKGRAPKLVKTKKLHQNQGDFADFYKSEDGDLYVEKVRATNVVVTLADGQEYDLYSFTREVENYWRTFLKSESINLRRSSVKQLVGERSF